MEIAALILIAGPVLGAKWDWILALSAMASGIWHRVQRVLSWVWGLVVSTNETEWSAVVAIIAYLDAVGKNTRKRRGRHLFKASMMHVRPLDKTTRVMMMNSTHKDIVFFYKGRPIFYHYASGEDEHCTFSYFRGTLDWKDLLWEVVQWEEAQKGKTEECDADNTRLVRFNIHKLFGSDTSSSSDNEPSATRGSKRLLPGVDHDLREWTPIHWKPQELGESHAASSLDLLALREELVAVVEEARFWFSSEAWYKTRGIPWRRSFGFQGAAGTGKTSLARGIAEDLDLPIYSFDIASMNNREFSVYWERATYDSPCMVLLEDVDAVFEGRKNKSNRPDALTFDCLLNCIDGAKRPDGLLLVITTNHIDRLDPALKRSGRMDRCVEFLPLDASGRLKIASRIVDDIEVAHALVAEGATDAAADFQERCFRVAIESRYKDVG